MWPRAPATRSSSSWREEEDDWQGQSTGPSQVGWASTGEAQVGFPLSLFLICLLFYFFLQLLGFIKKYLDIFKNPENNQGLCLDYFQQPTLISRII